MDFLSFLASLANLGSLGSHTSSGSSSKKSTTPKTATTPQGGSAPRGFFSELMNKIKTNPWKTLGTVLLTTAFPVGTAISGVIATGVVTKSAVDSRRNNASSKEAAPPQGPSKTSTSPQGPSKTTPTQELSKAAAPPQGKSSAPRGFRSELTNKIKKNPWKTLGTVLLATAFPVGTAIAGAIATGNCSKKRGRFKKK